MTDTTITCPKCGAKIPLTDALTHDLQETVRNEYQQKMEQERIKWTKEATQKAHEEIGSKYQELERANAEKDQKLKNAEARELDLLRQKSALEEKERTIDLQVARTLDQGRKKIESDAQVKAEESTYQKIRALEEQLTQANKATDDLKRRLEQGSMQIQGEVLEDDLKNVLLAAFPEDTVCDVPKGIEGADLLQNVQTRSGFRAGTIIWECKNAKNWKKDWVEKLKEDQAQAKADIAVIVSQVLPEGVNGFGLLEGVWITSPSNFAPLADAFRHQLIQLAQMKVSLVGKDEKMAILYGYITSPQFKNRMENIVSAFVCMKQDLNREQASMKKHWKKREMEIDRVIDNTTGMYGDLQGLIGVALPTITTLELPSGEPSEDTE